MTVRKEDARIIKTKAALTTTFFEMLTTMEIGDVTINALCERADIRRATFYKHFCDKNDFIVFLIKDIRSRFDTEIWKSDLNTSITKEYYLQYAKAIIKYLLDRETAIKKIINSPVRSAFFDIFLHENYEDTRRRLEASEKSGMKLISTPDVVASMLVGGIAHCIIIWFDSNNKQSADSLLSDISVFLEKVLG